MENVEEVVRIEDFVEVFDQQPHQFLCARILVSSKPFLSMNATKLSIWVEDPNGKGMNSIYKYEILVKIDLHIHRKNNYGFIWPKQ